MLVETKNRTGEFCETEGDYAFDCYLDGSITSSPKLNESRIYCRKGERFPGIGLGEIPCCWKLIRIDYEV
jgi:hypothetical protein